MTTLAANYRYLAKLRKQPGLPAWLLVSAMVALLLLSSVVSAAHIHEPAHCETPQIELHDCDSDSSVHVDVHTDAHTNTDNSTDHFCPSCQLGEQKLAEYPSPTVKTVSNKQPFDARLSLTSPRGSPLHVSAARAPPTDA